MTYQDEVFRIEREGVRLLSDDWPGIPPIVYENAVACRLEKLPTMVTWHHYYGWCVLVTAGQGPCLEYCENEHLLPES